MYPLTRAKVLMYSSDILADNDVTVNQNNYYNEKIKSAVNWSVKHTFVVLFGMLVLILME